MNKILIRPTELRQISEQLRASANKIGVALQGVDQDISSLKGEKFLGVRANLIQDHYVSKRDALLQAKELVKHFAEDLNNAANIFERADGAGNQLPSNSNSSGTSSNFSFPQWANDSIKWIKNGGEVLQDVALLAALRNGQTFADQVKIFGPEWYSKYVLGLPEKLRSIKASTLVDDLATDSIKATPWSTTFTLVKLAADIVPDWFKYSDTAHRGAAVSTDALIAAASLGASYYGIQAGALIGSAICPGVGTVVGGVAGGFMAGWATDHVLTTPFSTLVPEASMVTGGVMGNTIIPGAGMIIGGQLGNDVGKVLNGFISPTVAQTSIKDNVIEGLASFINDAGEYIGNQIYRPPSQQESW